MTKMPIATINPLTGETLKTFAPLSEAAIEQKLAHAASAFALHRKTSFAERAEKMNRAADLLERDAARHAELMAVEMGKPIGAGRQEALKCAKACRFYAENAERFLAEEIVIDTEAERSSVRYEPLGTVLAIMPWNFPFWQVVRFAAPALMAGNTGLLKHASNVPQCALALEQLFREAGFADGVFQTLLVESAGVARIIEDPRIAAVTLTGSEAAGSRVAVTAGKCIKKTVLELGGSDPFIVMPTARLDDAVKTAAKARTINSGQSCIAAKRFIVHASIYAEFERRFVEAMNALKLGDPLDETTDIGPLATAEIADGVEYQVQKSVAAGARLVTGGKRRGNFYEPTVLASVPRNAPAFHEEVFGPVASLFSVRNLDEAIALANGTEFGLGASAWTEDAAERARFISELEAGAVFINSMVASDPKLPFGGVKRSGYGRELGAHGIREFVNAKTVHIERSL